MKSIIAKGYKVEFTKKKYIILNDFVESQQYSSVFVLADPNTEEHCLPLFLSNLSTEATIEIISIEAGEENKNKYQYQEESIVIDNPLEKGTTRASEL